MEINPIYKFMKDNGLTQKDEAAFVSEYSNPQKSAELHKFMVDNGLTTKGADDFYSEYFAGSKKKEPTTPGSSQPAKPSTPSFGQKVTEKITNSASQTQIPLKTGLQTQEEKKAAEKKAKIPTSKYFEVDVEEKQDEAQAPKFADPIVVVKNSQKSKAIFNSVIGDKDIYKMPTPGESEEYASDITSGYLDYLELVGSDKSDTYKEKYKTLKAKSKEERTDQDEKFLRQVEAEAVGAFYDAKEWELGQVSKQIDDLQKTAVTDEQKAQLNNLYGQYEKKRNSLLGTSSVYAQNKLQYGKIAGTEMADEEAKLRRFEALQAGDGKTIEFFKGIGGAVANGVLSIGQVPKVFGDLIGDTDYDWSDEFYDMLSGQKSDLDREFGAPLPQGKNMTDLPFSARLAVVGGNAIGSAGLFAAGGGLVGATTNIGKAAATFGTAFLTSESGYYQEALEAGMSPQQAALAGTYLAAQTALIESIIPDVKYFEPSAFRKSVMQAVSSGIKSGLPVKEAAKLALKNTIKAIPESAVAYGKTGIKEAGEELLGQVGEDVGKVALNAAGERQYFNDTFNPESYTDAILGGFIAGGGMSVFSRPTAKSPVQEEVMREIVERRPQETQKGTASDRINKEDLSALNDVTEIYNAMSSHSGWSVMSREEQNHALALAQQAEVMKKEQERMKELRIPDERKDAEIKRLEDEVNQMFSVQMEQDKQKAKDAKLKAIEDEFNKSMEGEEFPVQEDERDQEIVELQKQREERGINELDTFLSDMKPMVPFAVERTEQGLPVAQSVKQAASNYLYKKYKELTDMKSDPNRMMTRGQIASVQKQLEQDIRTLEGTAETKTETRDQENIPGIPSQVREGQEPIQAKPVEVPSAEAPEAGRVLQAQEEVTPTTEAAPEVTPEEVKAKRRQNRSEALEKGKVFETFGITAPKSKEIFLDYDLKNAQEIAENELSKNPKETLGTMYSTVAAGTILAELQANGINATLDTSISDIIGNVKEINAKYDEELSTLKGKPAQKPAPEPTVKPSRRERLAKMFETSDGEIAAEKVANFLGEANIGVEVLDPKSFEEKGKQRNFEGSADGIFLVDNNTGKIYLNKERIKGAEGKTIAFHEGIHPVVNIIRNTNPKLYSAIVDGLKAEAVKNAGVAEAAEAVASSGYYQEQGPSAIEDETVVETMARVAAGDIDIDTFEPSFREKFIEFMNKLAKMLGLNPIAVNSPRMEVKRLADQLSKALNEGGKLSDVVGKENVGEFQNKVGAQKRAVSIAKGKESLVKYGLKKGVNTTRKIGEALEKRSRELYGIISREDRSEKALKAISSFMADEVRFFVEAFGENSGKGWYGEKFQKGLDAMAAIFPEMKDDQNARDLFTMLVAITSDGTEVMQNFQQASLAYKNYKETGKMPTTAKAQRAESYMVNFRNIQDLLDKYNGDVQAIKKELLTIESISELNQQRKAQGLEKLDTKWPASFKVPLAASIFGPKLGMFYANLSGMEQYPTLDRWWSRTFNRYRGTLIPQITRGYNKKGEALGIDRYREIAGLKDASEEEVLARIVQDHDTYEDKGYKKGTPAEKAANTLYKKLYVELNDAPFGAKDRQFMYDAFIDTQKKLKRSGIDVTIADIQAILWYFEKNLYKKLGVTKPIQGISYEDAANKTYEKWKNSGNSFNYTIKDSEQGETIDEVDIDEETAPTAQPSINIRRGKYEPLPGAPTPQGATGPIKELVDVAESYAKKFGVPYTRQGEYVQVDEAFAKRIADAYANMKHDPKDPKVKEAYDDLIRQTTDQYNALMDAGYEFTFFDSKTDPYKGNPMDAMRDLRANKKMAVYGTYDGYGTEGITGANIEDNPMLAPTGLQWPDQSGKMHDVTANDLFRAVHDAFGHGLEGAGFRARGEENAWQAHARLFTGPAVAAITSETRGQNSWLNYGPFGEKNRRAKLEDTIFAEQKTGLMPEWTWTENVAPAMPSDEGRTEPVMVENAPEGTYLNIGLKEGMTNKMIPIKTVLSKLPKDVQVIESTSTQGTEPTAAIKISRKLTDEEMGKLLEDTKQLAIPQLSDGEGVIHGTKDWGDFNADFFVLPNGKKLSDVGAKKGQPSMVKRTSAEVQRLMEDSMDSVDEAIADGVDAQTAVEDNITSQDWYSELTPKQKEQFDEIIKDEFGVTPKAPVVKPTGIKATIANIIDNYYKGDRESKAANTQILDSDPKLKYIYRNIEEINKQLQNAGVITDKTDGCP